MKRLIIINGYPRAGKDTVASMIKDALCFVTEYSTVDLPKKILRLVSGDFEKSPEVRKLLSDLKSLLLESVDYPVAEIESIRTPIVIVHCREKSNIQHLRSRFPSIVVKVSRKSAEVAYKSGLLNKSDSDVDSVEYDFEIENNSTLEDLRAEVKRLIPDMLVKLGYRVDLDSIFPLGVQILEE